MKRLLVIILASFVGIIIGFFAIFKQHVVTSDHSAEFIVNRPYQDVVFALARRDSMEKIVNVNNGRILIANWEKINLGLLGFKNQRLSEPLWNVEGQAWFAIETNDPHLGMLHLEFVQQIYANPNNMIIDVRLRRPHSKIYAYQTFIRIEKLENQTKFSIYGRLSIMRRHPNKWQNYVQNIVNLSNIKNVEGIAFCLQELSERRGISIPIK